MVSATTTIPEWIALVGAISAAIIGVINALMSRASHVVTVDTNQVVTKQLQSDDGSTLRDATDRIESVLGTTPPLAVDRQVFTATDHESTDLKGNPTP